MSKINHMQIVEQTDEEKFKMYMKCKKKELAKMLIEANKALKNNFHIITMSETTANMNTPNNCTTSTCILNWDEENISYT